MLLKKKWEKNLIDYRPCLVYGEFRKKVGAYQKASDSVELYEEVCDWISSIEEAEEDGFWNEV